MRKMPGCRVQGAHEHPMNAHLEEGHFLVSPLSAPPTDRPTDGLIRFSAADSIAAAAADQRVEYVHSGGESGWSGGHPPDKDPSDSTPKDSYSTGAFGSTR